MLDMSQVTLIVCDMMNIFRNDLASGKLGFKPASRMGCLRYNVTCGNLARRNCKECVPGYMDACCNTPDIHYMGQATYWFIDYINSTRTNWEVLQECIYLGFNQSLYATQRDLDSYPADGSK